MCGVFGYCLKGGSKYIQPGQRGVLGYLLGKNNDHRGGHSWGYATIREEGEISIERGMGKIEPHSSGFFEDNTLMAHTRFATIGSQIKEHSHPFEIGNIIGAHNGMIYNHADMNKKYDRDFKVDSMHLFAHLDEDLPFDELRGYGTIEWIEKGVDVINLLQMVGGDLSVFGIGDRESNDVEGIVWSSSKFHLKEALDTAGIDSYFEYDLIVGQVYRVRDHGLYKMNRPLLNITRAWGNYNNNNTTEHTNNNPSHGTYHGGGYSGPYNSGGGHYHGNPSYMSGYEKKDGESVYSKKKDEEQKKETTPATSQQIQTGTVIPNHPGVLGGGKSLVPGASGAGYSEGKLNSASVSEQVEAEKDFEELRNRWKNYADIQGDESLGSGELVQLAQLGENAARE